MNNDKRDKSAILSLFITILSAILTPIIQIASNFAIKTDNRPFIHSMKDKAKSIITACAGLMLAANASAVTSPVDYVNTLMGTDSKISLSNGNTVPSVALPWGMNQWIPQTGKMGDCSHKYRQSASMAAESPAPAQANRHTVRARG